MNLREIIDSWRKIFQISAKPTREEYSMILKITLLGLILIGLIAFAIRIVFYTLIFPPG